MTQASGDRPVVVLAMFGGLASHLLGESMERLATIGVVADPVPLERFDDDRADDLLGHANVLLTGWLCPPVTADVLERAPQLQLIAHAAGTVKEHLSPAVWERGIRVSGGGRERGASGGVLPGGDPLREQARLLGPESISGSTRRDALAHDRG